MPDDTLEIARLLIGSEEVERWLRCTLDDLYAALEVAHRDYDLMLERVLPLILARKLDGRRRAFSHLALRVT